MYCHFLEQKENYKHLLLFCGFILAIMSIYCSYWLLLQGHLHFCLV